MSRNPQLLYARPGGFTLVELLVCLGVLALLPGILLPTLAAARDAGRAAACLARQRELGGLVTSYTAENRNVFPAWLDVADYENDPERWSSFSFQAFSTLASERWLDWMGEGPTAEVLYCPQNRRHPDDFREICSPDYVMSASVFAEISYLDPDLPDHQWRSRLGGRIQTVDTAVFPSDKVALHELFVWHSWKDAYCEGCPVGELEYTQSARPGSVWFVDGHAEQVRSADALPYVYRYPTWPHLPFSSTAHGFAGRDR